MTVCLLALVTSIMMDCPRAGDFHGSEAGLPVSRLGSDIFVASDIVYIRQLPLRGPGGPAGSGLARVTVLEWARQLTVQEILRSKPRTAVCIWRLKGCILQDGKTIWNRNDSDLC